jgi:hypothetical protein
MTRPSVRIVSLALTAAMLASASPIRAADEERSVDAVAFAAGLEREDPGRAEALAALLRIAKLSAGLDQG